MKRNTPRHIFNCLKPVINGKKLKSSPLEITLHTEAHYFQRNKDKHGSAFFMENMQATRLRNSIFKESREIKFNLYLCKLSFNMSVK